MSDVRSRRVVLATFGSLGDLHPYLALARELRRRGHAPVLATSGLYRERVEAAGIGFAPLRPDLPDLGSEAEWMPRLLDPRRGPEMLVRGIMMPHLRATYEDLERATAVGADLLVGHPLLFALPPLAERAGLPWVGVALAPTSMFSAHDPPLLAAAPWALAVRSLGVAPYRLLSRVGPRMVRPWTEPVRALRRDLGLPPPAHEPLFRGQFSPRLNLALFSPLFGPPQPDWPPNTRATGFPFPGMPTPPDPALEAFLAAGPPPIVFTLGSSAVMAAGPFYAESARAAAALGRRAVLLIGRDPRNRPSCPLPPGMVAVEYAPFADLLPRAEAVVHQGGIGTMAETLRAGKPMLVVPFAFDQPDNARRARRLGVARVIPHAHYTARRAADALGPLLADAACARRAAELGRAIRKEEGASAACDRLEEAMAARG